MKKEVKNIRLCMGSSCFSRGNQDILEYLKDYLAKNNLEDRVDFRGHLCQGHCKEGPNLTIGDHEYNNVSISNIELILQDAFETAAVKQ